MNSNDLSTLPFNEILALAREGLAARNLKQTLRNALAAAEQNPVPTGAVTANGTATRKAAPAPRKQQAAAPIKRRPGRPRKAVAAAPAPQPRQPRQKRQTQVLQDLPTDAIPLQGSENTYFYSPSRDLLLSKNINRQNITVIGTFNKRKYAMLSLPGQKKTKFFSRDMILQAAGIATEAPVAVAAN